MEHLITKRTVLGGGLAAAASAALPAGAQAKTERIPYGAAANHFVLSTDAAYRAALARHCDVLVAEGAMKWDVVRAIRETFDFSLGDDLAIFAGKHGMKVRGHTLAWNGANPPWIKTVITADEAERELRRHIERMVKHYDGVIDSWDVVNEPVSEKPRNSVDLRDGVWTSLLGERYIDVAFRTARDVAPSQQRVLNEYGIEHATTQDRLKRSGLRRLILELKSRGVPVTAIGLQAHLDGTKEIDQQGVSNFCAEMTKAGLDILITELDVNDMMLPGDSAERDRIAAEKVRTFLDAVFAGCRPKLICTWGLTDRYTWMPMWFKRKDGLKNRPLPLDADLQPKPMHAVLNSFLTR